MTERELIHENIIKLDMEAGDSTEAIKALGQLLVDNNYIKPSYIDGVLEREENFPTGLVLANAGIAIPHASPNNNVLKNGIAAARLANSVKFHSMEDPEQQVDVNMIFILVLANSNEHLEVLKNLFVAFQNEALVKALEASKDKVSFLNLLIENLK